MSKTLIALLAASLLSAGPSGPDSDPLLDAQRGAFRDAWTEARRGNSSLIDPNRELLESYVLYPDLRARELVATINKQSEKTLEDFLWDNHHLTAGWKVRKAWLKKLAAEKKWGKYLRVYEPFGNIEYDCHELTARIETGGDELLVEDALTIWLSGENRPDACNRAFSFLEARGELTDVRRRQRVDLAIEQHDYKLAAFVARGLEANDRARVQKWNAMHRDPRTALVSQKPADDSPDTRQRIAYGLDRLARRDVDRAIAFWDRMKGEFGFTQIERDDIERKIAIRAARSGHDDASAILGELPVGAQDGETAKRLARLALKNQDWGELLNAVDVMPDDEGERLVWTYWRARATEAMGNIGDAQTLYSSIANERDYYGFLAADRLDVPYTISHVPAQPNTAMLYRLANDDRLIRAREFFEVGLNGEGRSQWDRTLKDLAQDEKQQAAILAHRWGWHSRAMATAAKSDLLDDLEIRYPMPYRDLFALNARQTDVAETWAYGIARSESLFMPDVASRAGALGLMQVMPTTGRVMAKRIKVPYYGRASLLEPKTNIALGTHYLHRMYDRFKDNSILATAAYNAGPHRVDRWLPEAEPVPADVWVDTIPFTETRRYVKRVTAAQIVFHWRMHDEPLPITALMLPIPTSGSLTIASK